jgi:hypothetical protein
MIHMVAVAALCHRRLICINGSLGEMSLSDIGSRLGNHVVSGGTRIHVFWQAVESSLS